MRGTRVVGGVSPETTNKSTGPLWVPACTRREGRRTGAGLVHEDHRRTAHERNRHSQLALVAA